MILIFYKQKFSTVLYVSCGKLYKIHRFPPLETQELWKTKLYSPLPTHDYNIHTDTHRYNVTHVNGVGRGEWGERVCVMYIQTSCTCTHTSSTHILAHLVHTSSTHVYTYDLVLSSRESSRDVL